MKKLTCLLLGTCLVFSPLVSYGQTRYYNSNSDRVGTSRPATNNSYVKDRFYDNNQNPVGYSVEIGTTTYYYNQSGTRIGTSVSPNTKPAPKAGKK